MIKKSFFRFVVLNMLLVLLTYLTIAYLQNSFNIEDWDKCAVVSVFAVGYVLVVINTIAQIYFGIVPWDEEQ